MDNDPMIKLRSMIANLSLGDQFIGYPMNCPSPSMNVPLSDDKHWFVQNSSLCAMDIQDNIWDKFFSDNFFSDKDFFFLGLNFVSDYIPQLYFVCNHLISTRNQLIAIFHEIK